VFFVNFGFTGVVFLHISKSQRKVLVYQFRDCILFGHNFLPNFFIFVFPLFEFVLHQIVLLVNIEGDFVKMTVRRPDFAHVNESERIAHVG